MAPLTKRGQARALAGALAQQLEDRLASAELDRAAGGGGDVFLGWIQAQGFEHRGVNVFHLRGLDRVLDAFGVGRA